MSRSGEVTVWGYALLGATMLVLQLWALRPASGIPTVSAVLRWGMRRRTVQLGVLLAWWWAGWHFLLNL